MFTGLIEEIGSVRALKPAGGGVLDITVLARQITDDMKTGDSISINGVCQTVTSFTRDEFTVTAVEETIKKSSFRYLKVGESVNLERSVTLNTRLGGHFVQGHCDCIGRISGVKQLQGSFLMDISYDRQFSNLVVAEGSIAVDGISLTIARLSGSILTVSVIPHTFENTILKNKRTGALVNLEFDILGKYVARMLKEKKGLTDNFSGNDLLKDDPFG